MKKYNISYAERLRFTSLVILNEMIQFQHYFPTNLNGGDAYLATYLEYMETKGIVRIDNDQFVPTDEGREELVSLYAKYSEYLKMFDIFCAVDLEKGEFAFSSITDPKFDVDGDWNDFLAQERFSDIRVAVADFKGINPIEIVFLSFLNENRFDCESDNWQVILTGDAIWNEIEEICNSAITKECLMQDDVLENVIRQGSQVALDIIKEAEENQEEEDVDEEYETITTTETIEEYVDVVEEPYYTYDYYYPYYDPFYVSPVWVAAAVILW